MKAKKIEKEEKRERKREREREKKKKIDKESIQINFAHSSKYITHNQQSNPY